MDIKAKVAHRFSVFSQDIGSRCTKKRRPLRTHNFEKNVEINKSPLLSPAN